MATTEHDQHQDTDGTDAGSLPPVPHKRRCIATTISVIGELLITVGAVLALFVAYSLWWTNVIADRQENKDADAIRNSWSKPQVPKAFNTSDGIGFLHVPAMGTDYQVLVKKGTSVDVLNQGVAGYYTNPYKSGMPWDKTGNFTLAAHRDGHGAKFHNIDKIKLGDPIVFEARNTWYIYKVYDVLAPTSKYNVKVLQPIPRESGKSTPGRYITLTTCTPVYTSRYRYIVWGELVRTQPVDAKRTLPPELR